MGSASPDPESPAATLGEGRPVAAPICQGYYQCLRRGEVIKRDWFSATGGPAGIVVRSTHTRYEGRVLEKTAELVCDPLWAPQRLRLDFPEDTSMLFRFGADGTVAFSGPSGEPEETYKPIGRHPATTADGAVFPLIHGMLYLPMVVTRRLVALNQSRLQFGTMPSGTCRVERQAERGRVRMQIEIAAATDELFLRMDERGHLLEYQSEAQKLDVHFVERSLEC
jgi:hypothetical protein